MSIELNNTVYRAVAANAAGAVAAAPVPLVLVHAFPVDHRMWDVCAERAAALSDARGMRPFAIIAPDMPGAADGVIPPSDDTGIVAADGAYEQALDRVADAYVATLHALGYRRAVWAGLSMGGYVVLDIQRRHPEAIAGLALCDTKPDADSPAARANRLRVADECLAGNTVEPVMHFAQPQPTDSTFKRSPQGVALFTGWIREQSPQGVAWRQRMAAGRPDLRDQLAKVSAPAAVICGSLDPFSPPSAMHPLVDAMTATHASWTEIDDCGHFSAVEQPDAVAGALVDLMARVAATDAAADDAFANDTAASAAASSAAPAGSAASAAAAASPEVI